VEERLDRFCASTERSILFPEAQVQHVDSHISDHLPILLRCKPRNRAARARGSRFQFENMWATDPSINEVIVSAWGASSDADLVHNLQHKIETCSASLSHWNKEHFGHVGTQIRKLEAQLVHVHDIQK